VSARDQIGVDLDPPVTPQAAETPPVEPEEPERPDFLLDKFKTIEEQARGYAEAERKIATQAEGQKRLEAQLAQLTEVVEQFRPYEQQQQQFQQPGIDQIRAQLQESFESDPIATMAFMAQQIAQQNMDARFAAMEQEQNPLMVAQQERDRQLLAAYADQRLAETIDDWDEFRERVGEAIIADQTLIPEQVLDNPEATVNALTRVYQMVKAEDIIRQANDGTLQQNQSMKRQAQSLTGGGVRTPGETPTDTKLDELRAAVQGSSYSAWRGGA
jgi:hypothetical protein